MATKRTYTIGFDLLDNVSSKYDALMKKLSTLTNTSHKLRIDADTSATSKVQAATDKVTKSVERTTAAFGSQKVALGQASVGFRSLTDSLDKTEKITSKVEASTEKVRKAVDRSIQVFGSQKKSLEQASIGFVTLANSMDKAERGHSRLGSIVDSLKTKYAGLYNVGKDFGDAVSRLAAGDIGGAAKAGRAAYGGALAATGLSTGALLVGGGVLAAGALTVPGAATWEKQVGRASKTALNEDLGFTKSMLSEKMLNAYTDLKGVDQQAFTETVGKAGSLGYFNEEAIQAATVGTKAGAAFELETSEAMRMLGVVNQMWAEQSKLVGGNIVMMEKAGSAVNVLGNKYAATEGNVLQFLSEAGGIAKVWKMDVAETAAVGALLETVNIKASEGETMFRSALNAGLFQNRAIAPGAEKSFRKLGIKKTDKVQGYDIAAQLLGVKSKEYKEMLNENMADTLLATTDVILAKTGDDSALAQQLSEAIFGSYGQGFLKLGGQRENLKAMTEESSKGFDLGTSLEEEYTRQTSNVIDTFGQTTKIFSSLGKIAGSVFLPPLILLLSVFNAIGLPIVKVTGFLVNLFLNQFGKIFDKFTGSNLGQDLGKTYAAFEKATSAIWEVVGPLIVKLLEAILDFLSGPILMVLWGIVAAYDAVRPHVLKIVDHISLVVDKLKGLWSWLQGAIPGYKKSKAEEKMLKTAEDEGLYLGKDQKTWYALNEKGEKTGTEANTYGKPPSETLKKQWNEWNALPSFYDSITTAISKGMIGVGDKIAAAVSKAMPDFDFDFPEFPDFSYLTDALDNLADAIRNKLGIDNGHEVEAESDEGDVYYLSKGKYFKDVSVGSGEYGSWKDPEIAPEDLPEEVKPKLIIPKSEPIAHELEHGYKNKNTGEEWDEDTYSRFSSQSGFDPAEWEKFDSGATFSKSGLFSGHVHKPEEIIPQATAVKGPGPISRALNLLYSLDNPTGKTRSDAGKSEIHIHNHNSNRFDFAGARFDANYDVEGLLRKIDARIDERSKLAVKNDIGNRR